jgi:hypothetical protein
LDSLLDALKNLADRGLTAGAVLAFLHHRRVVPLMERPLRIFEMTETADPIALARSRLPGRGAPSTPSLCATTGRCGTLRCSPPASW